MQYMMNLAEEHALRTLQHAICIGEELPPCLPSGLSLGLHTAAAGQDEGWEAEREEDKKKSTLLAMDGR